MKGFELLVILLIFASVIFSGLCAIFSVFYTNELIRQDKNLLEYFIVEIIRDIDTIGDLLLFILLMPSIILSVIWYCVYKLFCNKLTVGLMNIRIRKDYREGELNGGD